MDAKVYLPGGINKASLTVTGSKSETNRLLLLQALYPGLAINNISQSDDSEAMQKALSGNEAVVNVHHAGTAMRFLTAYYAIKQGCEVVLTGSSRMQERPIGILVEALRSLGASIDYLGEEGFPPLKIAGKSLNGGKITMKANVSSQYITALLLVAARLENGLELTLEGEITSMPYINMTIALLQEAGINASFSGTTIIVTPVAANLKSEILDLKSFKVESDWSSASYFYSIAAMAQEGTAITLSSYKQDSLQGDSALKDIYQELGVETTFSRDTVTLHRRANYKPETLNLKLADTPDIAQTIAVTCFGLGIGCNLTGLHTLKIKETDRLEALKAELEKLGAVVTVTGDSFHLGASGAINRDIAIATYNDHRMAMAFAALAVKVPITIKDAGVVSKSYPSFWEDMERLGFIVNNL
jgi:3-phosphoshikimate 1-carboxyvinyltransferase